MKVPSRSSRADALRFSALLLLLVAGCTGRRGDVDSGVPDPGPEPTGYPFPLETPALGGYKLVDGFPGADSAVLPMAVVWPKVAGAAPFVLERWGAILRIENGNARQVVDFKAQTNFNQEGGALGMALHPQFGDGTGPNPYVYVWYNAVDSTQHLSRFTWDPATGLLGSELLLVNQHEENGTVHNAGHIQFGPDGFLYFGNGDDAEAVNHQTLARALFAGIFRIDVDMRGGSVSHPPPTMPLGGTTQGYFIPNDNPFVGVPGALEEFYALGMRNPFALSFDRMTGTLYVADVGEVWREEINRVVSGGNYEWPLHEGEIVLKPDPITLGAAHGPVYAYSHAEMGELASIIGGFVYRGASLPELQGKYLYSDWPSTRVWAVDVSGPVAQRTTLIDDIASYGDSMGFAEDNDGEVYLLRQNVIAKIARDAPLEHVPKKLSNTTLFKNVKTLEVAPGFVAYDVTSPLWSDGAVKQRYVRVPRGQRITADATGKLQFPVGTVFLKQFDLPRAPAGRSKRLETRAMIVGSTDIYGVTYRWSPDGTDGELVTEPTDETMSFSTEPASQTWRYPSFGQCWSCHRAENRVLGFTLAQLATGGQLEQLVAAGVLDPSAVNAPRAQLVSPKDAQASLEARAMSYLAANCSHCHHQDVRFHGDLQTWIATPGVALADRGLINQPNHNSPVANALGMPRAMLVEPGHPERSLLLGRLKSIQQDTRMPPLGRTVADPTGVPLIEEWIRSLPP